MHRTRATLAAVFALAAAAVAGAQHQPFSADPALADLPARWDALTDLFDVPGASITVVRNGETFVHTLGARDPDTGAPVTPDTMFYIASITKTYLATGICALAAEGRLSLDDPVKKHLPHFRLADSALTDTITIRDLLCHRYGVDGGPIVLLDAYTGEITDDRYWKWLPHGEVAGSLAYTNVHFTLLGRVIEQITGKDWRDYLDEVVFQPAGMTRTTGYASRMYGDSDCAIPSERSGDAFIATVQRKTDRTMHAAGGLGTTALDAARYMRMHLDAGRAGAARVLPETLAREMQTMQAERAEHGGSIRIEKGFGLGWGYGDYVNQAPIRFHGGGYIGTRAWMCLLPEQDAGLMIMVNGAGYASAWMDIVAIDLLERLTGVAPPWSPFDEFPPDVRERKAQALAAAPEAPAIVPAASLTRPLGVYTGWFNNPDLGTLIVEVVDGGLRLRMGDLTLNAGAGDAPDHAILTGQFNPPARVRFLIGAGGKVDQVRIVETDLGELLFTR